MKGISLAAVAAVVSLASGQTFPPPLYAVSFDTTLRSRVYPSSQCPSLLGTCQAAAADYFHYQFTNVTSSQGKLQTDDSVMVGRPGVFKYDSMSWSPNGANKEMLQGYVGSTVPVFPGTHAIDMYAYDACNVRQKSTMTLHYQCNAAPVISLPSTMSATVLMGEELLLDATGSTDPDPQDNNAALSDTNLDYYWCLMSAPSPIDTEYAAAHLRVDGNNQGVAAGALKNGLAYLQPLVNGTYVVRVTVNDGCNFVQQDVTITATVSCNAPRPYVQKEDSKKWTISGGSSLSVTLDSKSSGGSDDDTTFTSLATYCLPADYTSMARAVSLFSEQALGDTNLYQSRYSPVTASGSTATKSSLPWAGSSPSTGCTWPGSSSFDAEAEVDDFDCECENPLYMWNVTDCSRAWGSGSCDGVYSVPSANAVDLTFYSEMQTITSNTQTSCAPHTLVSTETYHGSNQLRDVINPNIQGNYILQRPSTSWDGQATFDAVRNVYWNFTTTADSMTTSGVDKEICTVSVTNTDDVSTSATIAVGTHGTSKDCIGSYDFDLSMWAPVYSNSLSASYLTGQELCPAEHDTMRITANCPNAPRPRLLANEFVLWNGENFYDDASNTQGWVKLDARDSVAYQSSTNWTWAITGEPPAHTYPGSNPAGAATGTFNLDVPPMVKQTGGSPYSSFLTTQPELLFDVMTGASMGNLTGAFLPGRGVAPSTPNSDGDNTAVTDKWTVTLRGEDDCNGVRVDNVDISAVCLEITDSSTNSPTGTVSQCNFGSGTCNAANNNVYTNELSGAATYNGQAKWLYSAYRVTSRPMAKYGDYYAAAVDGGYECILDDLWAINSPSTRSDSDSLGDIQVRGWIGSGTVRNNAGVVFSGSNGAYSLTPSTLDGCYKDDGTSMSFTMTCATSGPEVITFPGATDDGGDGTTITTTWGSSATFGFQTFTDAISGSVTSTSADGFGWYLTGVPAGDTTNAGLVYDSSNPALAAQQAAVATCTKPNAAQTVNLGLRVGQTTSVTGAKFTGGATTPFSTIVEPPLAPFSLTADGAPASGGCSTCDWTPTTAGDYSLAVQVDDGCNYRYEDGVTFVATCNDPARFMCGNGGSDVPVAPAAGGLPVCDDASGQGSVNNNHLTTQSRWNCKESRYDSVTWSAFAGPGADSNSDRDSLTYSFSISASSSTSWYQQWAQKYSASVFFLVTDNGAGSATRTKIIQGIADGYATLAAELAAAVPAAITTTMPNFGGSQSDASARVCIDSTSSCGNGNLDVSAEGLGVTVTPASCYTTNFGQVFKADITFIVLAPRHFSAFSTYTQTTADEVGGYSHPVTGSDDMQPYGNWNTGFSGTTGTTTFLDTLIGTSYAANFSAAYAGPWTSAYGTSTGITVTSTITNTLSTASGFNAGTAPTWWTVTDSGNNRGSSLYGNPHSTSYIPDAPTTYSSTVTVVDNCPGSTDPVASWTASANVASQSSCGVQGFTSPTFNVSASTTIPNPIMWKSKAVTWDYSLDVSGRLNMVTNTGSIQGTIDCGSGTTPCLSASYLVAGINMQTATVGSGTAAVQGPQSPGTNTQAILASPTATTSAAGLDCTNGCVMAFDFSWSSPTPTFTTSGGTEVRLECARGPVDTSNGAVSPNSWHEVYTVSQVAPGTTGAPVTLYAATGFGTGGSNCRGNSIVFRWYQPGASSTASTRTWTVSNIMFYQLSNSNAVPSYCDLSVAFPTAGTPAGTVKYSDVLENGAASTMLTSPLSIPDPASSLTPGGQTTVTGSYSVSQSLPDWISTGSAPTGCSTTSTTTQTLTGQCKNPALSLNKVSGGVYTQGMWSPFQVFATFDENLYFGEINDVDVAFEVTSAPTNSLYNKDFYATYIASAIAAGNNPSWSSIDVPHTFPVTASQQAHSLTVPTSATSADVYGWVSPMGIMGTKSWSVDPNSVEIVLDSLRDATTPLYNGWNTGEAGGNKVRFKGWQNETMIARRFASTSLRPDASTNSGSYALAATYTDGCFTSTSSLSLSTGSCPTTTVSVTSSSSGGLTRVTLQGAVNSGDWSLKEDDLLSFTWTITSSNTWETVTLTNADSFAPNFVPLSGATYTVSLTVFNGCNLPVGTTGTATVSGSCTAPSPFSSTMLVSGGDSLDRWGSGSLSIVADPNSAVLPGSVAMPLGPTYWMAEVSGMVYGQGAELGSYSFTCPSNQMSVSVISTFPSHILSNAGKTQMEITLGINGVAGLPADIFNSKLDDTYAVQILIGNYGSATSCEEVEVYNAAAGQITCWFDGSAAALGTSMEIEARVLQQSSRIQNSLGAVTVLDKPQPLQVVPVTGTTMPTQGGISVDITGYALAFPAGTVKSLSTKATAYLDLTSGQDCSQTFSCATPFCNPQKTLRCMLPEGQGHNQAVTVALYTSSQYVSGAGSPVVEAAITSDSSNILTYDAPSVTSSSPASGPSTGGYPVTLTLMNAGPDCVGGCDVGTESGTDNYPYYDLSVLVGGTKVAFTVTASETSSTSSQISFAMPQGCGSPQITMERRGLSSVTSAHFTYDAPTVECIGEPYISSTSSGCARIVMDGTNLAVSSTSSLAKVEFTEDATGNITVVGECSDIKVQNDYSSFSCRVPDTARPGQRVRFTDACGVVTDISTAVLPESIVLAGCQASFGLGPDDAYNYTNIDASAAQAGSGGAAGQGVDPSGTPVIGSDAWESAPVDNRSFVGIMVTIILLTFLFYVIPQMFCKSGGIRSIKSSSRVPTVHTTNPLDSAGRKTSMSVIASAEDAGRPRGASRSTRAAAARSAATPPAGGLADAISVKL